MRLRILSGEAGWPLIQGLEAQVYTPEVLAAVTWRDVVWSHADLRVLAWDEGREPVAHVGVYGREGLADGRVLRLGGIGGVMSAPAVRGRGFADAALVEAGRLLAERADLGVLFCEPAVAGFYARRGWRPFSGRILTRQPPGRAPFRPDGVMVLPLEVPVPEHVIDLRGLPW